MPIYFLFSPKFNNDILEDFELVSSESPFTSLEQVLDFIKDNSISLYRIESKFNGCSSVVLEKINY